MKKASVKVNSKRRTNPKVVIIMPARNSAKTLERTYYEIPPRYRKHIILADNASKDETVKIAKGLGIHVIRHEVDRGYGGNQKACYQEALRQKADIIVMVHPDNQYDPSRIPALIQPIIEKRADFTMGSRKLGDNCKGMPRWKYFGNQTLTFIENKVMGLNLSELHTGMRAYNRNLLETVPFMKNSDDFAFDAHLISQARMFGFRFGEIGIPTRYFDEASSINFKKSFIYGVDTISTMLKFFMHKKGLRKSHLYVG